MRIENTKGWRMRKLLFSSLTSLALLFVLFGLAIVKKSSDRDEQQQMKELRAESDLLAARVHAVERSLRQRDRRTTNQTPVVEESRPVSSPMGHFFDRAAVPPTVLTNSTGQKTYLFAELYGADGHIIAREAQFRELLGYTKLSFRTSEGIRYYDLDDVHPEVISSLGYDAGVLKRRLSEEIRQRQLLGARTQFQAELRLKAAAEHAEREKAAAERIKAEAALREAQARERLADAAERAATNPPKDRIVQRFLIVPGRNITNAVPPKP
jgi:hypothetical protein